MSKLFIFDECFLEARRLAQKKFNDARAVIAAQAEWPGGSDQR